MFEEAVFPGQLFQLRNGRIANSFVDLVQGLHRLRDARGAAFVECRLGVWGAQGRKYEDSRQARDAIPSAEWDVMLAVDGRENHFVSEDVRELFPERLQGLGESRLPRSTDSLLW